MLKMNNVTKSFKGVFEPVIHNLSLSVQSGEFCVILGANGSGKSTLLKLIAGSYQADSGNITINGQSPRQMLLSEVVQDVNKGTIAEMSLLENMALSASQNPRMGFYHRYKKLLLEKLKVLDIGLEQYLYQPLGCLSGGQRQMIATLMAMDSGRPMLLLDEHTSALDPKMQKVLMDFTARSVIEKNLTTLMITHNMNDAILYGDRLLMMKHGKIVLDVRGEEKSRLHQKDLVSMFVG